MPWVAVELYQEREGERASLKVPRRRGARALVRALVRSVA